MTIKVQVEWSQVYKGSERQARKLKQDYKARGYYTRMKKHAGFYTLEVGEPVEYKLNREYK